MNVTLDKSQHQPLPDIKKTIRQKALYVLARREYSYWELLQKLNQQFDDEKIIVSVLDQLKRERLLDDARFADAFIRMRSGRGYGPVRIQMDLRNRGIAEDQITTLMENRSEEWILLAATVRQKRFGKIIPKDLATRAKQMRFLQYRGFTHDQIKAAFYQDK